MTPLASVPRDAPPARIRRRCRMQWIRPQQPPYPELDALARLALVSSNLRVGSSAVRKRGARGILYAVVHPIASVRASSGDDDPQEAFARAVAPETPRLFGLALAIVRDRGEAEDVVQETMLSAWRSWSQLRDPSKQSAWLTRICVNHCLHRRRDLLRRILWPQDRWASIPDPRAFPARRSTSWSVDRAFRTLVATPAGGRHVAPVLRVHGQGVRGTARLPAGDRAQPPWTGHDETEEGAQRCLNATRRMRKWPASAGRTSPGYTMSQCLPGSRIAPWCSPCQRGRAKVSARILGAARDRADQRSYGGWSARVPPR